MNTGIAQLLGSSVASFPQMTYVPGIDSVVNATGILKANNSSQGSQADEANNPELQRLKDVCRDFEAIFLHQLFQIMRKSGPKSDLLDSGFASDVYEDILDQQLATEMSRTGAFGLADILYEQMREAVVAQSQEENNTVEAE